MIIRRDPCFVGIPAYYVDDDGTPLINDRGDLATEADVDIVLYRSEVSRELDRLLMQMCSFLRARGERLTQLELNGELGAFQRLRKGEA